jgi:hypothetical protein
MHYKDFHITNKRKRGPECRYYPVLTNATLPKIESTETRHLLLGRNARIAWNPKVMASSDPLVKKKRAERASAHRRDRTLRLTKRNEKYFKGRKFE